MADRTESSRALDEQAHTLEVIYLAIGEVQTINPDQETAKNWAMKTIREKGYELRDDARRLRLDVERDVNFDNRAAMLRLAAKQPGYHNPK